MPVFHDFIVHPLIRTQEQKRRKRRQAGGTGRGTGRRTGRRRSQTKRSCWGSGCVSVSETLRVSATAVKKYKEEFGFEFSNFGKTEMKKDFEEKYHALLLLAD